ncbi:MAG: hypothetical protein ABIJ34_03080 [archaeon]
MHQIVDVVGVIFTINTILNIFLDADTTGVAPFGLSHSTNPQIWASAVRKEKYSVQIKQKICTTPVILGSVETLRLCHYLPLIYKVKNGKARRK